MAKQTINIGTVANDGTGDTVRDAFDKVNDNFTELYTDDAGDVNSITATAPIARNSATGAVTISLNDAGVTLAKMQNVTANSLLVRNANSDGVLTQKALATTQILIGNGSGMTAAALSGDVTMTNTGAVTIANTAVETAMVANDAITHDKLEARYTAKATSTGTGSLSIECDDASVFLITGNVATATYTFNDMKQNQVIDLILSGTLSSAVITFAGGTGIGTTTFNKVGSTNLDTSKTNHITLICVKESSGSSIVNYTVNSYASDSNPD